MHATKHATFFPTTRKAALASGLISWNINWCVCAPTALFKNAKADVFNYREELKEYPNDPAREYALALALSRTNEHDEALALMRGLESKISSRIFYQACS